MSDIYIKRSDAIKETREPWITRAELRRRICNIPPANVRLVEEGKNITENNPVDEFVCSKCGIILEDWSRVEIDEDDGERTNHEYVFCFCPNCGTPMKGE